MTRRLRALLYGDVDMNVIDGSAVWAQSTALALADAGVEVTLVLKAAVTTDRLLQPLADHDRVVLHAPHDQGSVPGLGQRQLTPAQFAALAASLDAQERFDLVVLRGFGLVREVVADGRLHGRLWTYLTDIPQTVVELTDEAVAPLTEIADASRIVLCQTEELRSFLEHGVPATCGKTALFPPIVPEALVAAPEEPPTPEDLQLVYIGKFARRWNTLEMTRLPARLAEHGVTAQLHAVGDKIHRGDEVLPDFPQRMREGLEQAPGVVWHGGRPRAEAMAQAALAHVGLSWRDAELDASLELSTKVLEYGSLGLPVVLNRTPAHEALLGADYPLFAASEDDVVDALVEVTRDGERWKLAAERCRTAAAAYTLRRASEDLRAELDRVFPDAPELTRDGGRPLRVVVASHDLKFFTRILDDLRALPQVEVRLDTWASLNDHDEATSRELVAWADVVILEWCGRNAAWYSRHKRDGQRLILRLHRFELYTGYPAEVQHDAVDQVIAVSPHYAKLTRELTDFAPERVVTIPNWVDVHAFDRPKDPAARFHLGMIGVSPVTRKRLDLGIDVVERLRAVDPRFTLFVKSKLSWDYWWIWKNHDEQRELQASLDRLQSSSSLRDGVVFDGFGPDVAAWLRKIGFVLSTSDDESFHLSPAEGMASGAVPLVRDWPGADTIYADQWIQTDVEAMVERILDLVHGGDWDEAAHVARRQVADAFDLPAVVEQWRRILVEDLPTDAPGTRLMP
ncbi:glycosyltransferase [Egicoccus halophilus]|uniref:Glycosyl transferase n=1 Tax=Egicoccus halophilus TaxID=1670830 RepID=A0A8J3AA20_9ACTN|nr:glycosyltransferase [Egicoccus halophilus]GGI05969.1 glycosyl transferase [Egicoccus halophilus]